MEKEKLNQILEEMELQIAECFHQQQRLSKWMDEEMAHIKEEIESSRSIDWKISMMKSMINKLSDYQTRWQQQQEVLEMTQHFYNKMKGESND